MKLQNVFIQLIKSEITGAKLDFDASLLTIEDKQKLYSIAKFQDVLTILAGAFHSNNIVVDKNLESKLSSKVSADINYIEKQKFELENISQTLNENEIPFIPLKGSVLRKYYRQPYYRTSCDIDILVHQEDLEKVKKLFCNKLNYEYKEQSDHDFTFVTKSQVTIELHHILYSYTATEQEIEIFNKPWENAIKVDKFRYEFTNEFLYLYFIYHYKKHFIYSGCGIRHIIDLYVINTIMNVCADDYKEILEKIGLYTFSVYSEKLVKVWFENESHNDVTLSMEKFILESGIYGTSTKNVQIIKSKNNGKSSYFSSRLWLSREELYAQFPKAKKCKILIPFCQIIRWFRILFRIKRYKEVIQTLKLDKQIDSQSINDVKELFDKLKIQ